MKKQKHLYLHLLNLLVEVLYPQMGGLSKGIERNGGGGGEKKIRIYSFCGLNVGFGENPLDEASCIELLEN